MKDKTPKPPVLALLIFLSCTLLAVATGTVEGQASSQTFENHNLRVHEGDLIIESDEKFVLKNERLLVEGNVIAKPHSEFVMENSALMVVQEYKSQYKISSHSIKLVNSTIKPVRGLSEKYESFFKTQLMFGVGKSLYSDNSLIRARIGTAQMSKCKIENSKVSYVYWRPNSVLKLKNSVLGDLVFDFKRDCTEPGKIVLENLPTKKRTNFSLNTIEGGNLSLENSMVKQGWNINLQFGEKKVIVKDTKVFLSWLKLPPTENRVELDLEGITGHVDYFALENNVYGVNLPYNLILDNATITNKFLKVEPFGTTAKFVDIMAMIHPRGEADLIIKDSIWTAPNIYGMEKIRVIDSKIVGPFKFLYLPQGGVIVEGEKMGVGGKGTLVFDDSTISANFIKVAAMKYRIEGSVEIDSPESYDRVRWVKGKITRSYPVVLKNQEGQVASGIPINLLDNENRKVWSRKTDENGRASFTITFNENNYRESYRIIATGGEDKKVEKEVGFLTDTPITGFFEVVEPTGPPEFEVSDLSVKKKTVEPGENVTVSIQVTNTGGKKGSYTTKLTVGGQIKTKSVTLNPDQSEKVSFEISKKIPDNYEVKVGGLTEKFEVVEPAEEEKEEEGLPLIWIGLGIGIIVALIAGILLKKKTRN